MLLYSFVSTPFVLARRYGVSVKSIGHLFQKEVPGTLDCPLPDCVVKLDFTVKLILSAIKRAATKFIFIFLSLKKPSC